MGDRNGILVTMEGGIAFAAPCVLM
ncbi:hypothetical protein A2U01_0098526, partial [Trifolium medium]|nr:hypothetical protein [Trifolium medium]